MKIAFCQNIKYVPTKAPKLCSFGSKPEASLSVDVFQRTAEEKKAPKNVSFEGFFRIKNPEIETSPTINDFSAVDENNSDTYYKYKNSKVLENFAPFLNNANMEKGISTIPYIGDMYLNGDKQTPLGTSGVGNCAVVCFYNEKTGEQILYHVAPVKIESIQKKIQKIVPKDFNKVYIIPGCNPQTAETAIKIFDIVKKHNKNSQIEFRHFPSGKFNELVFYKGEVYNYSKKDNDALFEVCRNPENQFLI